MSQAPRLNDAMCVRRPWVTGLQRSMSSSCAQQQRMAWATSGDFSHPTFLSGLATSALPTTERASSQEGSS